MMKSIKPIDPNAYFKKPYPSIYIAGPMLGIEDNNYPLFNFVADKLFNYGWLVVNPVSIGGKFGTADAINASPELLAEVVRRELCELMDCDAICLLPGWETSNGARRELLYALNSGKVIIQAVIAESEASNAL